MSTVRGCPPRLCCLAGGIRGVTIAHCSSVRSEGYSFLGRSCLNMAAHSSADRICANYLINLLFCQAKFPDSLLIEGRMHIRRVYGKFDSCIDMHFEWIKIHQDSSEEIVALSDIAMTWVAIRGHGIVEVRPFPDYMQELIHSYLPYSQQHLG